MADVSVDTETGIVKVNKMVAVQDCGYVVSLKTAESQVYGALIMGITYALYEEKVMDQQTGRMLNANMEQYRLAGIGDSSPFPRANSRGRTEQLPVNSRTVPLSGAAAPLCTLASNA